MNPSHSEISPSGLGRVVLCPGSVNRCRGLGDVSSPAAEEGTLAHSIAAQKLRGSEVGEQLSIQARSLVDHRMLKVVDIYIQFVTSLRDPEASSLPYGRGSYAGLSNPLNKFQLSVEHRVSLKHLNYPDIYGTADCILRGEDTLHVLDFKYGRVPVHAKYNFQLIAYALGAMESKNYQRILLHIVQPRSIDHENRLTTWETNSESLLAFFRHFIEPAIQNAASRSPAVTPGETQCKWCKAADPKNNKCPEFLEYVTKPFDTGLVSIDSDELPTDETIKRFYPLLPMIKKWVKAMETVVKDHMLSGGKLDGYKLVNGRKKRSWADKKGTVEHLEKLGVNCLTLESVAKVMQKLSPQQREEINPYIKIEHTLPMVVKDTDFPRNEAAKEIEEVKNGQA